MKNKPFRFLQITKICKKRKGLEAMEHKILCTIKSAIYYAGFKGLFLNKSGVDFIFLFVIYALLTGY